MDYPQDSQFEDYHDFYACVLLPAYFFWHKHNGFDYCVVQDRYDSHMSVGFPEYERTQARLPVNWLAV